MGRSDRLCLGGGEFGLTPEGKIGRVKRKGPSRKEDFYSLMNYCVVFQVTWAWHIIR